MTRKKAPLSDAELAAARSKCLGKTAKGNIYRTREEAYRLAAEMSVARRARIVPFRCMFGDHWHLGGLHWDAVTRKKRSNMSELGFKIEERQMPPESKMTGTIFVKVMDDGRVFRSTPAETVLWDALHKALAQAAAAAERALRVERERDELRQQLEQRGKKR
jgi:hypothetical protein